MTERAAVRGVVVLITDPAFSDSRILEVVGGSALALPRGAFAVHLRDKGRDREAVLRLGQALRALTREVGAALVVHRALDIADTIDADGIHLGHDSVTVHEARKRLRGRWISVAAHSDDDVRRARDEGADCALVSPIFATAPPRAGFESGVATTKEKPPRGLSALQSARAIVGPDFPLYALGGITAATAAACSRAGASGVAVLRALLEAEDCGAVARAIHDAMGRTC